MQTKQILLGITASPIYKYTPNNIFYKKLIFFLALTYQGFYYFKQDIMQTKQILLGITASPIYDSPLTIFSTKN